MALIQYLAGQFAIECSDHYIAVTGFDMSIHKSLLGAGKLKRHRNVLTRKERLEILLREDRRQDEDSIFGLPKVRNIMARAKKKKDDDEEGADDADKKKEEKKK